MAGQRLAWLAGADGRIAQVDLERGTFCEIRLPGAHWVGSLARIEDRLFALAGETIWAHEIRTGRAPELVLQKSLAHSWAMNLLSVNNGGQPLLALAYGSGVFLFRPETLAREGGFAVRHGVRFLRPGAPGEVLFADREGGVGRYRLAETSIAWYAAAAGGDVGVRDLWGDPSGALAVVNTANNLCLYAGPEARPFIVPLSEARLGPVSATQSHWLVGREHEVIALERAAGTHATLTAPAPRRQSRVQVAADLVLVLDEEGSLSLYDVETWPAGAVRSPRRIIATGITSTAALCT